MRVGINGFGRIGRLVCRVLRGRPGIELVHINDSGGDAAAAAHLLAFDSVHGRWPTPVEPLGERGLRVGDQAVGYSRDSDPAAVPWWAATLQPYFEAAGLARVVVACPVKGEVAGSFGIRHGAITTLHDVTNTQVVVNGFRNDLRRARSCLQSLIPTSTGSARAIGLIFPDLQGKLNGHAVRVPLLNASLTDAVFELEQHATTAEAVNRAFTQAVEGDLRGILGVETRPLVSVDCVNDPRSAVVDAPSTLVVNGTQLKVYAWYVNEWGYSCRLADLACHIAACGEG
ncbi:MULTISPECIES: glyceraldehyde 3-phosphate dehydrogenase NAD-binding domain-containing protein [Aphanothece]|uniref:glyceraldehyde 3-phosphate dehydrogenase NAD-binding domain-containing protein n=1 Tax=Aphanothece TaxID=1121 RepID=UPI0039846657